MTLQLCWIDRLQQSIGNFVENFKNVNCLPCTYFSCLSIVNMVRKVWQIRKMGNIVPAANQIASSICPMVAVGNDVDLAVCCSLDIFRKLQKTIVEQR